MNVLKFHDECWDLDVWVVWPVQNPELIQLMKTDFNQDWSKDLDDGPFQGRCVQVRKETDDDEICFIIALEEWKLTPKHVAILTHEALHVTYDALKNRGLKFSDNSEEAYCYLLDSIVRRSMELLT